MKRILFNITLLLLVSYSGVSFSQIRKLKPIDEFLIKEDIDDILLPKSGTCGVTVECPDNFTFTTSSSFDNALANHNATIRAAEAGHRIWFNNQKNIMKDYINNTLGTQFSSFEDARNYIFKSIETKNINLNVPPLKRKYSSNNYRTRTKYTKNLKELNLLTLRENEISTGNINNSQYGHIKVFGVFLKDITSISALRTKRYEVNKSFENQHSINFEGKLIYEKLNSLGTEFSNYIFNKKLSYYNNYSSDWDKLDIVQYHINYNQIKQLLNCMVCIHPAELYRFKDVVDVAIEKNIEDYAKRNRKRGYSVFSQEYLNEIYQSYLTGPYHRNTAYDLAEDEWEGEKQVELNKLLAANNFSAEYLKIENFIGELGIVSSAQKEWLHGAVNNTAVNNLIDFVNDNRVNGSISDETKKNIQLAIESIKDTSNYIDSFEEFKVYYCDCSCDGSEVEFINDLTNNMEPKWGQLANKEEILNEISFIPNLSSLTFENQILALESHFNKNINYRRVNGTLEISNPGDDVNKYIYTEIAGWLDFHHVFKLFKWAKNRGAINALSSGEMGEIYQWLRDNHSAFSYEDLPSNRVGVAIFLRFGSSLESGSISWEQAIGQALDEMKWVVPKKAPNYDYIPHIINNLYPKNFTYSPLLGNELMNYHKKEFCKRSEQEQNNIREAHEKFYR